MALIVPCLLAADLAHLGGDLEMIQEAGVKRVHIDVCDGHFAPGITVGLPVVARLRKATSLELDVHLLVERPERFILDFIEAGADSIEAHPESTSDFYRVLRLIKSEGKRAGASLGLATPIETVSAVAQDLDFLSILSAEPGEAEQPYASHATQKLSAVLQARRGWQAHFTVQVEGGIDGSRMQELAAAGADVLVMGSEIFKHRDAKTHLKELIHAASAMGKDIKQEILAGSNGV
jgi:ribulose-phosphate 3-epimerase